MTESSEHASFYGRAMGRIYRGILVVSAGGMVVAFLLRGWRWAAGYALGAAISAVNLRLIHRMVDALGTPRGARSRTYVAVVIGLRYLLFGIIAYAIVMYFEIGGLAVVVGLLAAAAAILIEIVYELIYARA